jgi:hypothetical protein
MATGLPVSNLLVIRFLFLFFNQTGTLMTGAQPQQSPNRDDFHPSIGAFAQSGFIEEADYQPRHNKLAWSNCCPPQNRMPERPPKNWSKTTS